MNRQVRNIQILYISSLLYLKMWIFLHLCGIIEANLDFKIWKITSPVDLGCRIHWLNLYWGVRHPSTILNNLMARLDIWWMRSTSSLPLLPGSHWPGMVTLDRVPSMDQIEQTMRVNKGLMLNYDCKLVILKTIELCSKKSKGSF